VRGRAIVVVLGAAAGCDALSGLDDFAVVAPPSTSTAGGGGKQGNGGGGSGGSSHQGGDGGGAASGGGGAGGGGAQGGGGGGAPPCIALSPCTTPTMTPFWDDFGGSGLGDYWDFISTSSAITTGEILQELHFEVDMAADDDWETLETIEAYDFAQCGAMVKQLTAPVAIDPGHVVTYFLAVDSSNRVGFTLNGPNLRMQATVNGQDSTTTVAYDYREHRWWWVRLHGGDVSWYTSEDTSCWVEQRTMAYPLSSSVLRVRLGAGAGANAPPLDWVAKFDYLNVAP
jgi:hypothetical protein